MTYECRCQTSLEQKDLCASSSPGKPAEQPRVPGPIIKNKTKKKNKEICIKKGGKIEKQ